MLSYATSVKCEQGSLQSSLNVSSGLNLFISLFTVYRVVGVVAVSWILFLILLLIEFGLEVVWMCWGSRAVSFAALATCFILCMSFLEGHCIGATLALGPVRISIPRRCWTFAHTSMAGLVLDVSVRSLIRVWFSVKPQKRLVFWCVTAFVFATASLKPINLGWYRVVLLASPTLTLRVVGSGFN